MRKTVKESGAPYSMQGEISKTPSEFPCTGLVAAPEFRPPNQGVGILVCISGVLSAIMTASGGQAPRLLP